MLGWFRRKQNLTVASVVVEARPVTAPLNLGERQNSVAYCRYRLDALRRHMVDNKVSDKWREEARSETMTLIGEMLRHKAITPDEEKSALGFQYIMPEPKKGD